MPYGHVKQYRDLVREAQKKRIRITKEQQKEIRKLYGEIAADLSSQLSRHSDQTLTYRWLKDYAKELRRESRGVYRVIRDLVQNTMLETANAVTGAESAFWGGLVPELSERFSDVFSKIPDSVVNELLSGGVYRDFTGLSERIWNYQGKFNRDIQYVINQGIIAKKPAYDLAKDLEIYLNPKAAKPFDWSRVYPGIHKTVDYNAQRLARTGVTHAYQMSFQRSTRENPFIEKYKWLSSNSGRSCELCRQRNGRLFEKDELPLDHPNGMCTVIAVIPKSYEQIADELADWANGKENPGIENWLNPDSKRGIINTGRDSMGIEIEIDQFTPCLQERKTGKIVDTVYEKILPQDLDDLKKKGWIFDWKHPSLKHSEIYKLLIKGDTDIQGLVAIEPKASDLAYHLSLAESAPHNRGEEKIFEGVGGHLFAIATQKSFEAGYGGFIYFEAKNLDLVKHYHEKFGAILIGRPHEYSMIIDERAAKQLLESYTL